MTAVLINTAGILFALWRAGILWYVWRRFLPTDRTEGWYVFTVSALTGIVFHFVTLPVRGGYLIVSGALLLAFCAWRKRRYLPEAVFVLLLVYGFQALFGLMMSGLGDVLSPLIFRSLVKDVADTAVVEREAAVYTALYHLFGGVLLSAEAFFTCKVIGQPPKQTRADTAYLSVLNVIGIIITFVMTSLAVVPLQNDVFILTEEKRALIWVLPVIACLIYAGELAVLYAWKRYRIALTAEQQLFVEAKEKQALERRLRDAESLQERIRGVRHDMKNHLTNIKGLAAAGNLEELHAYIDKLDASVSVTDSSVHTGNAVTDVILADKKAVMEQQGIRFEGRFAMEDTTLIPVYDLAIVLGNLLDNAIEACEKVVHVERFIRLEQTVKGNFLLLTVENSFDGTLDFYPDGRLKSTKTRDNQKADSKPVGLSLPDAAEHGYGLKNVEEIAKRHLGGVTYHHEGNVFRVTVMLQRQEMISDM